MIKLFELFLCLTVQLSGLLSIAAAETGTLRYALCKNDVAQARVVCHDENYSVIIQLSHTATKDFQAITAKNVGRRLIILLNDTLVTSAIIKGEIDSGTIQSSRMTEDAAKNLQERALKSIEGPCRLVK